MQLDETVRIENVTKTKIKTKGEQSEREVTRFSLRIGKTTT